MADEIRTSISFQVSKGGAAIATGTLSSTMDMTGTDCGAITQDIGTSNEAIDVPADVSGDCHFTVVNLTAEPTTPGTEYVEIFKDSGSSHLLGKLWSGESMTTRRIPSGSLFGRSTGATQKIQFWISEV